MAIRDLASMTAQDVRALDRARTCVVFAVSPIEEHGPHLPLSTDIVESEGVARRLCARLDAELPGWTFLFYPPVPIGSDTFDYPGSVEVRPATVRAVVRDISLAFARQGFERILVSNHHGGPSHFLALDDAARAVERRSRARVLSLAGRTVVDLYLKKGLASFFDRRATPEAERATLALDCHAGAFETSEMLALTPHLVRDGWRDLAPVVRPLEKLTTTSALVEGQGLGYFGAPALASAELGEAYLDFVVERVLPDARRFLAGERVPGLPFGWRLVVRALVLAGRFRRLFGRGKPVEVQAAAPRALEPVSGAAPAPARRG